MQILYYPREFDQPLRDHVELAVQRARIKLARDRTKIGRQSYPPNKDWEAAVKRYILRGYLAFTEAACGLLTNGPLATEKLTEYRHKFMESLVSEAEHDQNFDASNTPFKLRWHEYSSSSGHSWIRNDILIALRNSPEFAQAMRMQERAIAQKLSKGTGKPASQVECAKKRKALRNKARVAWMKNRSDTKLTSETIAKQVGVSKAYVSAYLSCKPTLAADVVQKVEDWLRATAGLQ